MPRRRSQEHLKFTLFPFVSILLAVIGVLLFLTMLQTILSKAENDEEHKEKEEKQEINTRVYERIPTLRTSTLTFLKNGYQIMQPDGVVNDIPLDKAIQVIQYVNKMLEINNKHSINEESEREHLLFVVDAEGVQNYFSFFKRYNFSGAVKALLPTGLVLLNAGEKFKFK